MASLLPGQQKDFSSVQYWRSFFEQRSEAFEWYGDYADLKEVVRRELGSSEAQVLVVGCGNSSFSADLHDDGFPHILNVDFEESVIAAMARAHAAPRPLMRWRVADMTDMQGVADASFDAVIDKGAIDALMSEDTPEAAVAGARMLSEVQRVLKPGGRHLVVTLAQGFVARALLLGLRGWSVDLCAAAAAKPSPYLPFCLVATRPEAPPPPLPSEAAALAGAQVNARFDAAGQPLAAGAAPALLVGRDEVMAHVEAAQAAHRRRYDLATLRPGRFEEEALWLSSTATAADPSTAATPRYTLLIADALDRTAAAPCAAVVVPRGREHEWAFATAEGLRDIAGQAGVRRVIAVRCGRGHAFPDGVEGVKSELTPALAAFIPAECRGPRAAPVPILAVDPTDGLGVPPRVVEEGTLTLGGGFVVEEVDAPPEAGGASCVIRRLVFTGNLNVVQTEVRLAPPAELAAAAAAAAAGKGGKGGGGGGGGGGKRKGKKGKKSKGKAKARGGGGGGGGAVAADAAGGDGSDGEEGEEEEEGRFGELRQDPAYLCFEYHRAMLAAAAFSPLLHAHHQQQSGGGGDASDDTAAPPPRALVIGLGGGALPLALRRLYPCLDVTVVELEPAMEGIASRWFGFAAGPRLRVAVADGIDYVTRAAADIAAAAAANGGAAGGANDAQQQQQPFALICVDVDSKDASVGMSCPPRAFVEPAFLAALRGALRADGGILAVNVAARSRELRAAVFDAVASAFCAPPPPPPTAGAEGGANGANGTSGSDGGGGEVYSLRPTGEDELNAVVVAVRGRAARRPPGAAGGGGGGGGGGGALTALGAAAVVRAAATGGGGAATPAEVAAMVELVEAGMERLRLPEAEGAGGKKARRKGRG